MHWLTLFESLEDDLYDGQLGEDDWESPRILLEYTIVGGKFTNIMNNLENIKSKIEYKEDKIQYALQP